MLQKKEVIEGSDHHCSRWEFVFDYVFVQLPLCYLNVLEKEKAASHSDPQQTTLEKLDVFHSMQILFSEYFHTMELDFPIFFYNIFKMFPYRGRFAIFPLNIPNTSPCSLLFYLPWFCHEVWPWSRIRLTSWTKHCLPNLTLVLHLRSSAIDQSHSLQ